MELASGRSGTRDSDTKTLSSQLLISNCWLHFILPQTGFSMGMDLSSTSSPSHQERILSPQLKETPRKDSNWPGLGHMMILGPITVARRLEPSDWLSLGHVPKASRGVSS